MFVDASALAALLLDERTATLLAGRLQTAANRMTAPPSILEAIERIRTATGVDADAVAALMERFLAAMSIRTASLPAGLAAPAAEIMARFGRLPDRPGGLSANQCLSLAAARYYRLPLLHDDPALAVVDIAG